MGSHLGGRGAQEAHVGGAGVAAARQGAQGHDSIEKSSPEFWLEKSFELRLEILYTKTEVKNV